MTHDRHSARGAAALRYARFGWFIFPLYGFNSQGGCLCGRPKCSSPGKHPRIKWKTGATNDLATVEAWWRRWPNAGIGCATGPSGLAVFDLDGEGGRKLFLEAGGVLETLRSKTARGWHVFYKGDIRTGSDPACQIDWRGAGGYVVLPPSPHVSGHIYAWEFEGALLDCPAALIEWTNKGKKRSGAHGGVAAPLEATKPSVAMPRFGLHNADPRAFGPRIDDDSFTTALGGGLDEIDWDEIARALACIPASCDRQTWWKVGMALHSVQRSKGFQAWDMWSRTCPEKYQEDTTYVWSTFKEGAISLGTLFDFARKHGYRREEVMPLERRTGRFDTSPPPKQEAGGATGINGQHALPEILTQETTTNQLIKLNGRFSVIGNLGGKCLVLEWKNSELDQSVKIPSFQSFRSFTERFANEYIEVESDGDKAMKPLGAQWLKWGQRRSYEGLELIPNGGAVVDGCLNLWRGFGVEPRAGSWAGMRRHIADVLAGGVKEYEEYILRWSAWSVQNPGERAEAALVFRGGKGSGKGVFATALRRIFGAHGLQIHNRKHLIGAFNEHLRNCLLLFADEAFWAGDKQGESVLKGLITEPCFQLEGKGLGAVQWRNRLHIIMAANADWVVPASDGERRYAVLNVDNARAREDAYFKPLWAELENGGLEAMLHGLLAMDLGDWHPRMIPQTEALQEQKGESLDPLHEWWENMLQTGELPYLLKADPLKCGASALLDTVPSSAKVSPYKLAKFLQKNGARRLRVESGSIWELPELKNARLAWDSKFGKWPWEENLEGWKIRN